MNLANNYELKLRSKFQSFGYTPFGLTNFYAFHCVFDMCVKRKQVVEIYHHIFTRQEE